MPYLYKVFFTQKPYDECFFWGKCRHVFAVWCSATCVCSVMLADMCLQCDVVRRMRHGILSTHEPRHESHNILVSEMICFDTISSSTTNMSRYIMSRVTTWESSHSCKGNDMLWHHFTNECVTIYYCERQYYDIISNLQYKIWVHRPSIKGTKPLSIEIKAIITMNEDCFYYYS